MRKTRLITALSSIVLAVMVSADTTQETATPVFEQMTWQTGDASIMTLFAPYIGRFASTRKTSPTGTEYFFTIHYQWYDSQKTIVKYALTIEFPEKEESREIGEGYYRFDRLTGRIGVVGVFRDGRSGAGFMTPFDVKTGSREARILAAQPDGSKGEVRDTFWVINDNTWGNRTYMRSGDTPWQQVSEDVYRRIEP